LEKKKKRERPIYSPLLLAYKVCKHVVKQALLLQWMNEFCFAPFDGFTQILERIELGISQVELEALKKYIYRKGVVSK
jgi:hypothetical protein